MLGKDAAVGIDVGMSVVPVKLFEGARTLPTHLAQGSIVECRLDKVLISSR